VGKIKRILGICVGRIREQNRFGRCGSSTGAIERVEFAPQATAKVKRPR